MNKLKGIIELKEGEIMGIASTEATDRDGEIIKQAGWDLTNYKLNPVLMVAHNYSEFPIGKATDIAIKDNKLVFKAVFSQKTQKAKEAYELVKEGILSAFSVGFIPRDFDKKDQNVITEAELLEISLVPVPANPEAIVMAKEFKENEIAKYIVKNFDLTTEKKEIKKSSKKDLDIAPEVQKDKVGEESEKAHDIDLKIIQKATGLLQEVCRELKKRGGVIK